MKHMKKALAILMMAAMLLSLSVAAFADSGLEKVTTKIAVVLGKSADSDASTSHSYQAFKIMDLYKITGMPDDQPAMYQYKLVLTPELAQNPEPFMQALDTLFFKLDPDTGEITLRDGRPIETKVGENENSSAAANLAAEIAHFVVAQGLTGTSVTLDTAVQLECGYWIIYETNNSENDGTVATKPILLDLRPTDASGAAVTQRNITLKDSSVTLDKTVNGKKEDTVAIGDKVDYVVTATTPVYEANAVTAFAEGYPIYELKDTLDPGLTYDEETGMTVTITGVDNPVAWREGSTRWDYKLEVTTQNSHQVLTVTLSPKTVLAHQGATVTLSYKAIINENVSVCADYGNVNRVVLTYSNNPEVNTQTKTLEDSTKVYSFSIALHKLDGAKDVLLEGAKFSIYAEDPSTAGAEPLKFSEAWNQPYQIGYYYDPAAGTLTEITTSKDAYLVFLGLNEGTYYLQETTAPTGYAKLADPAVVTVTAIKDENGNYTGACRVNVTNATVLTEIELGSATTTADGKTYAGYGSAAEDATADSLTVGDCEDINVILRNYKGITLPETGSISALLVTVLGMMTVMAGAVILLRGKKYTAE